MDGSACFVGLALAGGILAVLLGVGWYGDRKRDKAYEGAQPEEGCSAERIVRMMSVRLTIRLSVRR